MRIGWVDISKAIAIVLMVAGHTSIPRPLSNFIWSFHMPLFFIASGLCTVWDKHSFGVFLLKKTKTLLVSFIFYSAMVLLLASLIGKDSITLSNVFRNGWGGYALWFVPVLLVALLVSKAVKSIPKYWIQVVVSIALLVIGATLRYCKVSLPWTVCTIPYATFLVLLGSWLKRFLEILNNPKWWFPLAFFIPTIVISSYWRLDLAWNFITPVAILTIGALSGTLMVFSISYFIDKQLCLLSRVLQSIGRETFVIMAFSQILGDVVQCFIPCNKIVEYLLMFLLLFIFAVMKNGLNKLIGFKLLS